MLTTDLSESYQQQANQISDIDGFVKKPLTKEELIEQFKLNSKISVT